MNARELDACKKLFRSGILDSSHPKLAGVIFSQTDPLGGKYNVFKGVASSVLLQDKKTSKVDESTWESFIKKWIALWTTANVKGLS
jgi:hypothetical protein